MAEELEKGREEELVFILISVSQILCIRDISTLIHLAFSEIFSLTCLDPGIAVF